jgi:hypothetical protein
MNRPFSHNVKRKILANVTPRAQQMRDALRYYFRHTIILGKPGAFRVHYQQKYFRWPCHTSDAFGTLESVAAHIGGVSISGSTGNEAKRQQALAARAVRRFPALLKINQF